MSIDIKPCYIYDMMREWFDVYGNQNFEEAKKEYARAFKELYEYQQKDQKIADLETKLVEIKTKCYTVESYNDFLLDQCKKLIKDNKKLNAMIDTLSAHDKELEEIHNQDKISFAVERLEKVKEWCEDNCDTYDNDVGKVIGLDNVIYTADMPLYDYIDNQIKQLKETV